MNYCIILTMSKVFGARVAVIIDEENSLVSLVRERNKVLGVEYTS